MKIQAWTSKCLLLCSPMSQDHPRGPQEAKVKPSSMPKDRFADQQCQDPLATMPRIRDPEAMSNDRGPAAGGVAHKKIVQLKNQFTNQLKQWLVHSIKYYLNLDEIRRPLLVRGTKAAGLELIRFLAISGHAVQLSGYASISLEGSNRTLITLASSTYQDPFASLKIHLFSNLSPRLKNPEKRCSRLRKNRKTDFEIH